VDALHQQRWLLWFIRSLADVFGPLLAPEVLKGKKVLEIGSGTGRIVHMLLAAGAAHVTAVEPSRAMSVLKENTSSSAERITYLQCRGDELPGDPPQDFVVSIGVLHHIPEPQPVITRRIVSWSPAEKLSFGFMAGRETDHTCRLSCH